MFAFTKLMQAMMAGGSAAYTIAKSLRFRSSASAYLNRTASATIGTYTVSMWVKRGTLGTLQILFGYANAGSAKSLFFQSDDTLGFLGGSSTGVYRDPAAWYHVVASCAAGAINWYVNGSLIASASSSPSAIQSGEVMYLGRYSLSANYYFDGEMAEINFVDGQALAPTAFGASSIYNQWLPKKYAGTYGTNGFYLPFSAGTSGYASYFNGTNSYVTVAANAALTVPSSTSFTIEAWIYITNLAYANGNIICANSSSSSGYAFLYNPTLGLRLYAGGGAVDINQGAVTGWTANTWYHVAAVRNGASAITLYRNGVSVATGTSTSSFGTGAYFVGASPNSPDLSYMNGYISNFRLVNGTAVYTAAFTPPTAALTAVTNTALLTLQNATFVDNSTNNFTVSNFGSAALGQTYPFAVSQFNDASGNSNNWTNNNVSGAFGSTLDYLTDVPTLTSATVANYAVMNPLDKGAGMSVTDGNLTATVSSAGIVLSTIGVSTGKWYWEMTRSSGSDNVVGIANASVSRTAYLGSDANGWGYIGSNGNKINAATSAAYGAAYASGVVVGVALDMTAGTLTFYRNNVSQGTAYSSLTGTLFAAFGTSNAGDSVFANFGQQPFTYTPPTGFLPLNTFNI